MIVKLGDIARECKCTTGKKDCPIVGLEHLEPKELLLKNYSSDPNTTFTKSFKAGQILFGRRRSYQQKASVATFDGICSGDIIVIEAIPEKVEPRLLPFIIQNEAFFNYSIIGSAGGLSPRVKWQHLANYEFELPSLEEQRVLADKLWAAYEVKESYKNLLARTDKLLHAQFEKMFGDPFSQNSTHRVKLQELCTLNPRRSQTYSPDLVVSFFPMEEVREDGRYTEFSTRPYSKVCKGFTFAEDGDVIFAKITPCMENGKGTILRNLSNHIGFGSTEFHVLRPKDNICTSEWLYVLTSLPRFREEAAKMMSGTGGQKRVPLSFLADFLVNVPDIKQQEHFATIFHQNEKTKELLRKGIEAIEAVIRSLIAEGTTKV